jgi:hypothetical protein
VRKRDQIREAELVLSQVAQAQEYWRLYRLALSLRPTGWFARFTAAVRAWRQHGVWNVSNLCACESVFVCAAYLLILCLSPALSPQMSPDVSLDELKRVSGRDSVVALLRAAEAVFFTTEADAVDLQQRKQADEDWLAVQENRARAARFARQSEEQYCRLAIAKAEENAKNSARRKAELQQQEAAESQAVLTITSKLEKV